MRKIYLVPNFVTTANMFCGFYSIISSIHHDFVTASWAIIAASVFDMLDGRIARMAKATSLFGVEYDSLSDLISFGAAPAVLLYLWSLEPYGRLGWAISFLFLACGALRLARFNVNSALLPKGIFQGLPIPMGAGLVSTFVIFTQSMELEVADGVTPLILGGVIALLMISTIQFPSFKEFHWRSQATYGFLLAGVIAALLILIRPEVVLFLILSAYVVLSLIWNVYRKFFVKPTGTHIATPKP